MLYRARVPAPPLDRFVQTIWIYEDAPRPHTLERLLPTGAAQLIVNLRENRIGQYDAARGTLIGTVPGAILAGVQSQYSVISTRDQEHVAGVSFKPGGTVAFMRAPSHETCDADVALDDVWEKRLASTLRDRLLEARDVDARLDTLEQVLRAAWTGRTLHPSVAFALDAFGRRPHVASVSAVMDGIALSRKRFIDRFKADVGVTPKRYCRILRFQQALASVHTGQVDWVSLALDCGYADQPHFIHEFRAFTGLTPTEYPVVRTGFQNHVTFLQDGEAPA